MLRRTPLNEILTQNGKRTYTSIDAALQHRLRKERNMASAGSPAREAAPGNSWSVTGMIGDWIRQGTEGFIATQKILLDLAAQQNALALTIARERLGVIAFTPSKTLIDLTSRTVHNFMEAQQMVLDIAAKQNEILADGLKPGYENTPVEALAEVVHQGLANCISAQKHFLEFMEAEVEGAVADFGDGRRFDTGRLAGTAREGVRTFVRSQKKFLDIIDKELLAESDETAEAGIEHKPIDFFDIAKESVDAYVEAQKRLLDLASDQIDVNVKFVKELFSMDIQRRPPTTIPDVLKKSADSFVAAQKALVELASKPRKPAKETGRQEPEIVLAKA
jgi:hypothetical protein